MWQELGLTLLLQTRCPTWSHRNFVWTPSWSNPSLLLIVLIVCTAVCRQSTSQSFEALECWRPGICSIEQGSARASLTHLHVPYSLPHSYEVAGTLPKHIEVEEIAVCLLAFDHDLANSQTSKWEEAKLWSSRAALRELVYAFVIRSCAICPKYDPWIWVGLTCLFDVWLWWEFSEEKEYLNASDSSQ